MTVNWRDRRLWLRIGYVLTFVWVVAIYEITKGDSSHPLSRFMFLVPLGAWVVGLVAARIIFGRRSKPPP